MVATAGLAHRWRSPGARGARTQLGSVHTRRSRNGGAAHASPAARRAVHRDQIAERGLDINDTVHHNGGALVGSRSQPAFDIVGPYGAEVANVVPVDPFQSRVVLVAQIAADLGEIPVARRAAVGQ